MKCAPDAEPTMPYGVPGLKLHNKNLIAVAAHKNHLGVYPFSPAIVKTVADKFSIKDISEGTIRFSFDVPPAERLVREIITLRAKEIG